MVDALTHIASGYWNPPKTPEACEMFAHDAIATAREALEIERRESLTRRPARRCL